jgi:DNA-binding transcriptional ArsR family regulator
MGVWLIDADTLAQSRFAVSPLAETMGCLLTRVRHGDYPSDEFGARFAQTVLSGRWLPDFMCLPPRPGVERFEDELARVRAVPAEQVMDDLAVTLQGRRPGWLHRTDVAERVADLLERVWRTEVRPQWTRRKRAFQADIVARTQQLSSGGLAAALNGMRPGMRWLGGRRLQINAYEYPPMDLDGVELLFIPVTARRGWVAWEQAERRYAVVYPCSGLLAQTRTEAPRRALERLLGPVRARVLTALDSPKSTTQLVALTGHGLGSVGGHLKVLLDAGLVTRRRSGRSVLYYRTEVGDAVVE